MKPIFAASLLLLVAAPALAQSFSADARTGCRVVNAHPQPHETVTWSGDCKNGVAEGRGVLQWYEGGRPTEHYEGEMRGGELNGQGNLTTGGGGHYVGDFRHGMANGQGTLTTGTETLTGTWKNGCYSQAGRTAWVGADPASCR